MRTLSTAMCVALLAATSANAALIGLGDPTTELDGDLFLDDASTGGGDTAFPPPALFNPQRTFDIDGMAGPPGVPGTVTIQGFGFSTNASLTQNTAPSVNLTFIYLGANEIVGGGDDQIIGTETIDWNNGAAAGGWDGAGTYFVNLDTDPSLFIDGLGERFRVTIERVGGPIRLKQSAATNGIKLSVSGTFAAIPEPSALLSFGVVAIAGLARPTRRR